MNGEYREYRENVNGGCEYDGCDEDATEYDDGMAFCAKHAAEVWA
jgi:hypothetical protein